MVREGSSRAERYMGCCTSVSTDVVLHTIGDTDPKYTLVPPKVKTTPSWRLRCATEARERAEQCVLLHHTGKRLQIGPENIWSCVISQTYQVIHSIILVQDCTIRLNPLYIAFAT